MEMPLENDSNYGYCGEGAEEALDNAWLSLAEKVSIVEGICGDGQDRGHDFLPLPLLKPCQSAH